MRERPDGGSPRLETLPFGAQIFVTGRVQGGPWYRVELEDGRIGYVWTDVLEPMVAAVLADHIAAMVVEDSRDERVA